MKYKSLHFLVLPLLLALGSCDGGGREPWEPLFNGKDLTEFTQLGGGAPYRVEDGVITGTSRANTDNSFLCTKKSYGDFILEFKVLVDTSMNSGVQIRSHAYVNGRVHGYQVEIDPAPRAWSGGLYDEARRGWLFDLSGNPAGRAAFRNNEWNQYRVEAIGNSFKTWVNGVMCTNLVDEEDADGFIAFQVHSIDLRNKPWSEGVEVKWKDIRIMTGDLELYRFHGEDPVPAKVALLNNRLSTKEKEEGWQLLFDGDKTDSWRGACTDAFPDSGWLAGNGALVSLGENTGSSLKPAAILTRETYSDFDLRLDFKLSPGTVGGIKYLVKENPEAGCLTTGLEYCLDSDSPDAETGRNPEAGGGTEDSGTMASLYGLMPAGGNNKFFRAPGQWNMARIVSDGTLVTHWLNGQKVLEYDRSGTGGRKDPGNGGAGPILLEGRNGKVSFRNIRIRVPADPK